MRDTRGFESLIHLHELAVKHATPEQRERLLRLTGGGAPSRAYRPVENSLYMAEAMAILFERAFAEQGKVREMLTALTETPKKNKEVG
jgi:hypothetical protein